MPSRPRQRQEPAPIIELLHATLRRGERIVLRDVSWSVAAGEVWAIVGPNGAGKTTLVEALRGVIPVAEGEVRHRSLPWRGRRRSEPMEKIICVSFDGQRELLGKASGYYQSRWHAGEDESVPRVRELLPARKRGGRKLLPSLGLARLLDRRLSEISNGERRKVSIALAVLESPGLLILDNPFAGLDAAARKVLLRGVGRLLSREAALLITTSKTTDVPREATHLLLLEKGRVASSGRRKTVERSRAYRQWIQRSREKRPSKPARVSKAASLRASTAPPLIEIRDATLTYGGQAILSRLTWMVRRGERWAVLGPNGAGKTSLLSLVQADNPQAYANDITLFGRRRGTGESIWEIKRKIGCVSPEMHLFHGGEATALEVVGSGFHDSIGLYRRPTRSQARTARGWLRRVGLISRATSPFRQLSEGEQRLALLARALIKSPELLILDEPCQGLDQRARGKFLEILERLLENRARLTLLYVSHEPDEIPAGMTHGLVLRAGRALASGPIAMARRAWPK